MNALIRRISEFQPDLIHTHRQKENILGSIANLLSIRAKSVRTTHGAPEFIHSGLKNIHKILYQQLDILCGRFLQNTIICVTPILKELLKKSFNAKKLYVIYNGVEISEENSRENRSKNIFKIAIAGRLVPVKRIDIFIQIAKLFSEREDSSQYEFHIFGDGPLREDMTALTKEQNIHDYVFFHGHVNNMRERIQEIDLLVMCSDHEGMPMIALEAVSSGTPVLAHAVGGLIDLLNTNNKEFLVSDNLAENYVEKILDLKNQKSDSVFKELIESCHERFSADNNADQIMKLYQSLING